MQSLPVLPRPDFLSTEIKDYLAHVSEEATRNLSFVDKTKVSLPFAGAAAILVHPTQCDVYIFIDPNAINEIDYKSERDDPLLAHEITHLNLYHRGWKRIWATTPDRKVADKVRVVENFLTDPIVNQTINATGFSLTKTVIELADKLINDLNAGNDPAQHFAMFPNTAFLNGVGDVTEMQEVEESIFRIAQLEPIGRFMASYLDLGLPVAKRQSLVTAFSNGLPELWKIADKLIQCVNTEGFDDPGKFQRTATSCLKVWGVEAEQIQFVDFQRCTNS